MEYTVTMGGTGLLVAAERKPADPHEPISVTILDTVTGKTIDCDRNSRWYWTEGNGSCDCNRALLMLDDEEYGDYLRSIELPENACLGERRFLVVAAGGVSLAEFNHGYPADLVRKHVAVPSHEWGERERPDGSRYFIHADLSPGGRFCRA